MGVIILYRRSYSMVLVVILWDIIKGVISFVRAVSIFFKRGPFFYRIMTLGLLFCGGSLYFVTPAHNKTNKCPVRLV